MRIFYTHIHLFAPPPASANMFQWLTRCPTTDPALARLWRLLNIFLSVAFILCCLNGMAEGRWSIRSIYSLITIGGLSAVYFINQSGWIRLAAWLFFAAATAPSVIGVLQVASLSYANPYFGVYYLLAGIGIGGVFFSFRTAAALSILITLTALWLSLFGIEWAGGQPWQSIKDPINYLVSLILSCMVVGLLASYTSWSLEHAATEIRERKAAEQIAEAAQQAAEAANKAKSLFLANMSHELRTPMTTILGYTEMLYEEATAEGHTRLASDLERIETSGKHLLSMINDILDLSKIEAGKMDIFVEAFSLSKLLSDADLGYTADPLTKKQNNKLIFALAPGLDTMATDLTKLRQVMLNLIGNAAKFTENGKIWVRAEPHPKKPDWIQISVKDTGIGMTSEQLERLFQPFVQGDSSTTKRYGGTGLGLALSRNICGLLGGDISAESKPGEGSCFMVSLPLRIAQPPPANASVYDSVNTRRSSTPPDKASALPDRTSTPPISLRRPKA